MSTLMHRLSDLLRDEDGANLIEYVLLLSLIALACIGTVRLLGSPTASPFNRARYGMTP